jgi:hypothetical protein
MPHGRSEPLSETPPAHDLYHLKIMISICGRTPRDDEARLDSTRKIDGDARSLAIILIEKSSKMATHSWWFQLQHASEKNR